MTRRLRVLVADDEPVSRKLIGASLSREHEVQLVEDGQCAVEAFTTFEPDAVLLDVDMPRLDGVAATRELKRLAGTRFVPVFLVSGLEEQATLIRGLSAGADDFLPKPFNAAVFKPKLEVFLRLQDMQRKLVQQNEQLEAFRRETEAEHAVATRVFEKMMARGAMSDGRVRAMLSPLSVFNGDSLQACVTPTGQFRMLLADGTGHGLQAALGTLPLTTLFHTAASNQQSFSHTAEILNAELKATLPAHLFSTAVLLELDRERGTLDVINCGMPDVWVQPGAVAIPSRNVPLGINRHWVPEIERVHVSPGDRVFLMSDGVVEATDGATLFGKERVRAALANGPPAQGFDRLLDAVQSFAREQSDDLSLVELMV